MIWLCIRGAAFLFLVLGSAIFWGWLLMPGPVGKYGSPEYWQSRNDNVTMMFGGFGLFICVCFVIAVVLSYWQPWKA